VRHFSFLRNDGLIHLNTKLIHNWWNTKVKSSGDTDPIADHSQWEMNGFQPCWTYSCVTFKHIFTFCQRN